MARRVQGRGRKRDGEVRSIGVAEISERLKKIQTTSRGRLLQGLETEAQLYGRGGVAAVHRATGIAKSTILRGLGDLESGRAEELAYGGRTGADGRSPTIKRLLISSARPRPTLA